MPKRSMPLLLALVLPAWLPMPGALAGSIVDGTSNTVVSFETGPDSKLRQIGIGLNNDGSYLAGDGSVKPISADNKVHAITIPGGSRASLCVHNASVTGEVKAGFGSTVFLGANTGLTVTPGNIAQVAPPRGILDGSSNTILVGAPGGDFCLAGITLPAPVVTGPPAGDGIYLGSGSSFDLCISRGAVSSPIADGTSNTISFGETRDALCFANIVPASNLAVTQATVPEPGLGAFGPALLLAAGLVTRRRRAG